jgi:hypothetical protein
MADNFAIGGLWMCGRARGKGERLAGVDARMPEAPAFAKGANIMATKKKTKTKTPTARTKAKSEAQAKKTSALDAAAKLLARAKEPLSSKQMIEAMAEKGYWASPKGKTPAATLHSAIQREIGTKGNEARFKKVERGKFALA